MSNELSLMISVVIPAHNAAHTLGETLQAIARSDYADFEVVVVDDASTDGTGRVAAEQGCRVVTLPQNVGAAQAKNLGVGMASGDIILFTDADIVLREDTLGRVAQHLQDDSLAGVVGLLGQRLRFANFSSQFKNLWMHYTYTRLAAIQSSEHGVGVFFTSIAAIRKPVFLQMGGFDSHYRGASITEDIEFGQRLLTAGHRVRIDGQLWVEHLKYYSLQDLLRTDFRRAFGLTKTLLRKKVEADQRAAGQKYYASVPWFFALGIPLSWLMPALVLLAVVVRRPWWAWAGGAAYLSLLLVNAPFLWALYRARGWFFLLQSCLFLPVDLWVSGLGSLWAMIDYLRGNRY